MCFGTAKESRFEIGRTTYVLSLSGGEQSEHRTCGRRGVGAPAPGQDVVKESRQSDITKRGRYLTRFHTVN